MFLVYLVPVQVLKTRFTVSMHSKKPEWDIAPTPLFAFFRLNLSIKHGPFFRSEFVAVYNPVHSSVGQAELSGAATTEHAAFPSPSIT